MFLFKVQILDAITKENNIKLLIYIFHERSLRLNSLQNFIESFSRGNPQPTNLHSSFHCWKCRERQLSKIANCIYPHKKTNFITRFSLYHHYTADTKIKKFANIQHHFYPATHVTKNISRLQLIYFTCTKPWTKQQETCKRLQKSKRNMVIQNAKVQWNAEIFSRQLFQQQKLKQVAKIIIFWRKRLSKA